MNLGSWEPESASVLLWMSGVVLVSRSALGLECSWVVVLVSRWVPVLWLVVVLVSRSVPGLECSWVLVLVSRWARVSRWAPALWWVPVLVSLLFPALVSVWCRGCWLVLVWAAVVECSSGRPWAWRWPQACSSPLEQGRRSMWLQELGSNEGPVCS